MTTVLDIVYTVGDNFALDTREIADEFFAGDIAKAYRVLKAIPGLIGSDVNGEHASGVRHNGKLACLVWQVWQDSQGWTREEARAYCIENKADADKEV